ncbi:Short-chain dehydrogenase/reductase family protein [Mycena venus]|uniref:Short-chain dehydrogenase/reductase family protein n=1 Tax=Mycena venus TaxID=2733690 RepID=A0A8H6YT52_9AGAR|nr:Short-chain dehydrogenase/reductase family protein [Mycena venus]
MEFMKRPLAPESPIFSLFDGLEFMNFLVGDDMIADRDAKHALKCLRNLTMRDAGMKFRGFRITINHYIYPRRPAVRAAALTDVSVMGKVTCPWDPTIDTSMSLPTFTPSTTADDVAATFAEQIRGKNVLITGTSVNGIGFEAARVLAKYANLVIITGLRLSEETIKKEVPSANIRQLVLDLSSMAAVRKAAEEVNAYSEPLHVLIHNAAAPAGKKITLTVDGLERQMAVAQIGPFLLTKLLAPKLLAARSANYTPRVVMVSSKGHMRGSGVNLSTVAHPDPEKHTESDGYFQAKSANILFASELTKRAEGKINAYSLHPGLIHTNIEHNEGAKDILIIAGILTPEGLPNLNSPLKWKTLGQGAATTVAAAFDTRLDAKPGSYLVDSVEANDQIAPHSSDPERAAKLWTITEKIVGEKFTF